MSKWNQGELSRSIRMASPDPEIREAAKFGLYLQFLIPVILIGLFLASDDLPFFYAYVTLIGGFITFLYLLKGMRWLFLNHKVIFFVLVGVHLSPGAMARHWWGIAQCWALGGDDVQRLKSEENVGGT
jgi:hypothetical protein